MNNDEQLLIALDLDGTSVRYEPRLEMDPVLINYLHSLRSRGIRWVMNSDRYTDTMVGIAGLLGPEEKPAAILSCQRFIHLLNGNNTYLPEQAWNTEQLQHHTQLWDSILPYFHRWSLEIEQQFTVLDSVANDLVFAYMVTAEQTPRLRELMRTFITPWPDAQVSGNQEWTFILHAAFSKGSVLEKCAELMGIDQQHIIAVGDGINDLSMLDGSVTPQVGCPANASPEVIKAVTNAGGMVADSEGPAGTLQVIKQYMKSAR